MLVKTTLLLTFCLLLTACGQMGPLYLPDQKPPVHVAKDQTEKTIEPTS